MSLARLVVTAVRLEGRTKAEVARGFGVSPRWIYELCRRFDRQGDAGLDVPRHVGTMSRDITWCPRQESNLRHIV
jgi:transposase